MSEDTRENKSIHDPGQDAGATLAQTQAGEDLAAEPPPEDLRDTYGNAGPAIGSAVPASDFEVGEWPTGPYGPGPAVERPHASETVPAVHREPTRDASLSRAVDRAAAGLDPAAAGYDRSFEGPAAGPLEPDADESPADAGDGPGGQWGSSG